MTAPSTSPTLQVGLNMAAPHTHTSFCSSPSPTCPLCPFSHQNAEKALTVPPPKSFSGYDARKNANPSCQVSSSLPCREGPHAPPGHQLHSVPALLRCVVTSLATASCCEICCITLSVPLPALTEKALTLLLANNFTAPALLRPMVTRFMLPREELVLEKMRMKGGEAVHARLLQAMIEFAVTPVLSPRIHMSRQLYVALALMTFKAPQNHARALPRIHMPRQLALLAFLLTHALLLTLLSLHPCSPCTLALPVPLLSLHPCSPCTLALPAPLLSLHPCSPCTLALPAPLLSMYPCSPCTLALPAPLLSLHPCSTCTLALPVPLLSLHPCSPCTLALPAPLLSLHPCSPCTLVLPVSLLSLHDHRTLGDAPMAFGLVEFESAWNAATEARPLCFERLLLPGVLKGQAFPSHPTQGTFLDRHLRAKLGLDPPGKVEWGRDGVRGWRPRVLYITRLGAELKLRRTFLPESHEALLKLMEELGLQVSSWLASW
ncbi:unnamed protein product [Closterium sp. NIES-65]|nr:unnamed protein product [Closterium sp. NIES-65]